MFKIILFVLFLITDVVQAQSVRTINADYIDGNNSGFRNYATNPYLDRNLAGVTCTSFATCSLTTTEKLQGTQSLSLTATSASGTAKFRVKTFDRELYGQNCEFSIDVFTSASVVPHYDVYLENNGTQVSGTSTAMVEQANRVQRYSVFAPCGSSTDGPYDLVIDSNATTGTNIKVDNFYAGINRRIGSGNFDYDWTSWTPTLTGFGTATNISCFHKRQGSDLIGQCKFTAGTTTGVASQISLPNSLTIDSTWAPNIRNVGMTGYTQTSSSQRQVVGTGGNSYVQISCQDGSNAGLTACNGSTIMSSGESISINFRVKISGWSSGNVIAIEQTNYDWVTETCTGSWSTNTTHTCKTARVGSNLWVKHKVTVSGAPTSATLTLTVPGSRTIDTAKIPGTVSSSTMLSVSGSVLDSGTNTFPAVAMYASTTTLTVQYHTSATAIPLANVTQVAPMTFASGDAVEITYVVPISGWTENQNAPLLVGGMTTAYSGVGRAEWIQFGGSTVDNSNCTGSPCTIHRQSGSVSSVTRVGTGNYTVTFNSGVFSDRPTCNVNFLAVGVGYAFGYAQPTSTTSVTIRSDFSGDRDTMVWMTCMGPK